MALHGLGTWTLGLATLLWAAAGQPRGSRGTCSGGTPCGESLRRAKEALDDFAEDLWPAWMHEAHAVAGRRQAAMNPDQEALYAVAWRALPASYVTVTLAAEPPREWTAEEREALREVLLTFGVPGVEGENPCAWPHVYCVNGHDVAVYAIFAIWQPYSGRISPAIGKLHGLRVMQWRGNGLTGSIPREYGDLVDLQYSMFDDNALSGYIPPELSQLTKLWKMTWMSNDLTGYIPPEIGRQSKLVILCFGDNPRLMGTLPPSLGNLTELKALMLLGMNLTGPFPDTWAGLTSLTSVWLGPAGFTGGLKPNVIGAWTNLQNLYMHDNPYLGGPVPEALCTHPLKLLWIQGNNHTGELPARCGQVATLQSLKLNDNGFSGHFPDTANLTALTTLIAHNNKFSSAGRLSPMMKSVSFSNNALTEFPSAWHDLPEMEEVDVSDNWISGWPAKGGLPREAFTEDSIATCGIPLTDRFRWPKLRMLNVARNPLRVDVHAFLHSLGYLPWLARLFAAGCELHGDVPNEMGIFIPGMTSLGDTSCVGQSPVTHGFAFTNFIDLSANNISAIYAPAPPVLSTMKLGRNRLEAPLHSSWWGTGSLVQELDVRMNPALQQAVAPPQQCPLDIDECPEGVDCRVADHHTWKSGGEGSGYECTSLCRVRGRQDVTPDTLAERQMCRCQLGFGGEGLGCQACPADTYSNYKDELQLVATCVPCPAHSTTGGATGVASPDGCLCDSGFYAPYRVEHVHASCEPCPEFSFTRGAGSQGIGACQCDTERHDVRRQWSEETQSQLCGCPTNHYMNRREGRCVECTAAESCVDTHGLTPPIVKPGSWAEDVENITAFGGHSIYRCFSRITCVGNSQCATGRHGVACSQCLPGWAGGSGSACSPCEASPGVAVAQAFLSTLPVLPCMVLLQSFIGRKSCSGNFATLKSVGRSVKQMLRYGQVLGVIFVFKVDWPDLTRSFFEAMARVNVNVDLGVILHMGCFASEQTVWGDMAFRWSMVLITLAYCALAIPTSHVMGWLLRRVPIERVRTFGEHVSFGGAGLLKLWVLFQLVFYSSLVQSCFMMLVCSPGPNGVLTVNMYPHIVCYEGEFWNYFPASILYTLFFGVTFLSLLLWMMRQIMTALHGSNMQDRGSWWFICDDYRVSHIYWPLCIIVKDLLLNLITVAFSSQGLAQLLIAGLLSLIYAVVVGWEKPFRDSMNNAMEVCLAFALFVVCMFSAGMGFSSEPGTEDISSIFKEGASDPGYILRARWLFVVQVSTIAVPCLILACQVLVAALMVAPATQRFLPTFLKPMTAEARQAREEYLIAALNDNMHLLFSRLDDIEFDQLDSLLSTSLGTSNILDARSSKGPRAFIASRLRKIVRHNSAHSENQSMIMARLTRAQWRKSRLAENKKEGPQVGAQWSDSEPDADVPQAAAAEGSQVCSPESETEPDADVPQAAAAEGPAFEGEPDADVPQAAAAEGPQVDAEEFESEPDACAPPPAAMQLMTL